MAVSLMRYIKYSVSFCIIILLLITFAFVFLGNESEKAKQQRLNQNCWYALKRISIALLEYAQQDGHGLYLPETLNELVKKGYLKQKEILFCKTQNHVPYRYIPNLRLDMPGNIPIIIEQNMPHLIYLSKNKTQKRAFGLFLDFTVYSLHEGQDLFILKETEQALDILKKNDEHILKQVLEDPYQSFRIKSMALWRLGQQAKPVYLQLVKEHLYHSSFWVSRQAAFTLWQWNKQQALPFIYKSLLHHYSTKNYLIRKYSWSELNNYKKNSLQCLVYLSPRLSASQAVKLMKKR